MKKAEEFFITGMLRTGSTLLDKLLHNHPDAKCMSQPAQSLFLLSKKCFLEQAGLPVGYMLLSNYWLEKNYDVEAFTSFLESYQLNEQQLQQVNNEISKLREKNTFFTEVEPLRAGANNSFVSLYRQLVNDKTDSAQAVGLKESLSEEYVPYLMGQGIKCVIILRDPRDTLASVYFGQGKTYTGTPKPILLMTRNWRKSVAFALEYADHENMLVVLYEDLVARPTETMAKVTDFLKLPAMPEISELRSQSGDTWQGNSSFEKTNGISTKSVGTFRKQMSPELQHFVESICFPEMKVFNYEPELSAPDRELIAGFVDPFENAELQTIGEPVSQDRKNELQRLSLLDAGDADAQTQKQFFIFSKAYQRLRSGQPAKLN